MATRGELTEVVGDGSPPRASSTPRRGEPLGRYLALEDADEPRTLDQVGHALESEADPPPVRACPCNAATTSEVYAMAPEEEGHEIIGLEDVVSLLGKDIDTPVRPPEDHNGRSLGTLICTTVRL